MAWSNSKIFSAAVEDVWEDTFSPNVDSDNLKAALFDNTITPSQTVASSATAYAGGVLGLGWRA